MFRRAIFLILLTTTGVLADTWTNAAGNTMEATLIELDGRTAVFERPTGEEIRLSLFSLTADEQKRVKEQFNGPEVPVAFRTAYSYASTQIERARLLFTDGALGDVDYANRRAEIIRSFKKACEQQSFAENKEEIRQLVSRLLAQ